MAQEKLGALEVKREVYADHAAPMDERLARFTWSHGGTDNWYKNKSATVIANSPWPLLQYWEWTRAPAPDDFIATALDDIERPVMTGGTERRGAI